MTKTKKGWLSLTAGFCLVLAGTLLYPGRAYAALANPVQITSVDYEEENIEVKNNGNTKIYFATETETGRSSKPTAVTLRRLISPGFHQPLI